MRKHTPPEPREKWDSPVKDYAQLTEVSCQLMLDQSKCYFEQTVAESEELTQRSANMLFLLLPAVAAVVGFCISNQEKLKKARVFDTFLILVCLICLGFCIYKLFRLISPKKIHYKGGKPVEVMRPELFELTDADEIQKALFVSEIERLQVKTEQMEFWNYERIFEYRDVVISFCLMLFFGIILLFRVI